MRHLRERSNELFTTLVGSDRTEKEFLLSHFHPNDHVDLNVPLSRHNHRTLHFHRGLAHEVGSALVRWACVGSLTEPCIPGDFQI